MAARVTGGIGDYVVIARLLRDLALASPALSFHIYCSSPSNGEWVFKSVNSVHAVFDEAFFPSMIPEYDCALYLNQFVYYDEEHFNLVKVSQHAPKFAQAIGKCRSSRRKWDVFIQHHPTLDGAFAHTAVALGETRYSFMYSQLGLAPGPLELDMAIDCSIANGLERHFSSWITVNNGYDSNIVLGAKSATKCYPKASWEAALGMVKRRMPHVALIQIGSRTSERLSCVDACLVGQTSLAQACGVLHRGLLHLDAEGGLVHVAAALGKKSVVLFGPTSRNYFAYPGNINVKSEFCGDCWWSTERWMEVCPRGYSDARCMSELSPEMVANAVVQGLVSATCDDKPETSHLPLCVSED